MSQLTNRNVLSLLLVFILFSSTFCSKKPKSTTDDLTDEKRIQSINMEEYKDHGKYLKEHLKEYFSDTTKDFRVGQNVLSINIAESKDKCIFIKEYILDTVIDYGSCPKFEIKEVWSEKKACFTIKKDSLEVFEKPLLNIAIKWYDDQIKFSRMMGNYSAVNLGDTEIFQIEIPGLSLDSMKSEIKVPLRSPDLNPLNDPIGFLILKEK